MNEEMKAFLFISVGLVFLVNVILGSLYFWFKVVP